MRAIPRNIPGIIIGLLVLLEGIVALSIANVTRIDGIGVITQGTFLLAALQLSMLGLFVTIVWILKGLNVFPEKAMLRKIFRMLAYVAAAIITVEGLAMIVLAGNLMIEGFGGVGKIYVVLAGAQLFGLGLLSLYSWRMRNVTARNWPTIAIGTSVATLLMMEGLSIWGISGETMIKGFGVVMASTMELAGIQLFLIGAIILALWWMSTDELCRKYLGRFLRPEFTTLAIFILVLMVCIEALYAASIAGTVTIFGPDGHLMTGFNKLTVVIGCSQLFALGLLTLFSWDMASIKVNRRFVIEGAGILAAIALATEGVAAIGLAANTYIDGIGTIMESTFRLAGTQLLLLAVLTLAFWYVRDFGIVVRKVPKWIVDSMPGVLMAAMAMEGLIVATLAVNIIIDDFSGVSARYVMLGGIQMAVLAAFGLVAWMNRSDLPLRRIRRYGTMAASFLLLMIPIAAVL